MSTDTGKIFAGVVFGLLVLFFAIPATAFQGFDDGGGGGLPSCAACHGTLADSGPGNPVHDAHAEPANSCSDCHAGSTNNPPLDDCVQCHGRNADAGGDSESAGIGRGLRLHHTNTGAAACDNCHSDSQGTSAFGENELPSFYAQAFNGAGLDPCDGSEELYASATFSLDNDGDGLTDGNDPDCVANVEPTANPNGPYTAVAGSVIRFSSAGSSDPDGSIVSYDWNFGDSNAGTGPEPTHTYQSEGTFTVSLTVTDDDGATDTASTTATINPADGNTPPSADAGGPYTGFVGDSLSFDGSASADTDGSIVRFDWDFGDNSTAADAGPAPTHIFAAAGEYTITLTVTDDQGASASATTTATLAERAAPMDGEAQYNNYCASCHGDPWTDPPVDPALAGAHRVAGARSCSIEASIFGTSVFPDGAPGMQFLQTLISDGTIDAQQLADYLNSQSVSGEQRYVAACAGCHGDDGRGGRTREGVRGESAHETRDAIREEQAMRFLGCLPDSDINAITEFLGGSTDGNSADTESSEPHDDDRGGGAGSWLSLMLLVALARRRRVRR